MVILSCRKHDSRATWGNAVPINFGHVNETLVSVWICLSNHYTRIHTLFSRRCAYLYPFDKFFVLTTCVCELSLVTVQ